MIEGRVYRGLVDSGAQVCLIAKDTVLKNHDSSRIKKCNVEIVGIGGGVNVIGEIILMMQVAKDIHMDQTFIVVENLSTQLLLGANFLIKNRLVLDLANKKVLQEQPVLINPANGVNLNCDYKEVKLVENIDLKPQSSTVVAYKLDADFLNNKFVTNIGIFSDEANLDKNLLIASFIIDSKCDKFLMPIMNFSDSMIQLKADPVIAFAQKLNFTTKGGLSEKGREWVPKNVGAVNIENESLSEKFRMNETDLSTVELAKVDNLLKDFKNIVSMNDEDVGRTDTIQHKITLTKDTAIKQPIRRVTGDLANQIEEILLKDEAAGIIRRCYSAWSSCIVPVKKKCGGLRLAIDYRRLNDLTLKDSFPLPNLTDAVYNLHGAKYFSTLDLTRGYYNVPMHEDSIHMTAFSTSRSHWEFVRMPFDLCNAGATFQRLMNLVLCGFRWDEVLCYIDDVLVLGVDFDEH
ncbi:unnamed protein product [Rotaria magnacalcarata]|uniref:Reverse transcriptase domain-containing protein n=1 Tax=Rotaria magnacalcarata TaxID=392030 RepID=A0A820EPJ7_9BILA|nr:unnamed protein product [Rotaria magnacalcarata]CAF4251989.1 unnamed protein product [Rotaria magnacalcarata]